MMKEAFQSIKNDYQRSLFYWLTFLLTTLFIFVFFQIACSPDIGMSFINAPNNVVTYLCVFVLFLCMFAVFFANDFYVKKKSKELAVQLVCGATFLQLTIYLLSQTIILFIVAVPLALLIGKIIFVLITIFLGFVIPTSYEGYMITIVVLFCEIFWCTLLNLGYAYRSSIKSLIQGDRIIESYHIKMPFHLNMSIKKGLSAILLIAPIILFYIYGNEPSAIIVFSIIGMIGLSGCLNKIVIPYMNQWIQREVEDQSKLVYIGFLRRDLKFMKNNILFLVISAILMVGILVMGLGNMMYFVLIFISYCVSHCLLSLTIMFRFSTEMLSREKSFLSLRRIGYEDYHIRNIIQKEIILLYGFILFISLIYIFNILFTLYIHHFISLIIIIYMIIAFVLPLMLCALFNMFQYLHFVKIK